MIVVDTNVIAYLYLPGDFTRQAEGLRRHDPLWAAPILWRTELRNALALYLRKELLTFDQACAIQSQAEALLTGNEYHLDSHDVLRLAVSSGCSAYDCEFVALADRLQVPLVTTDKKLLKAFPRCAISLAAAIAT